MTRSKRNAIYHTLSIVLLTVSVLLSIFRFESVFFRTVDSVKDLGLSVAFYGTEFVGRVGTITPTVTEIPEGFFATLPYEWNTFKGLFKTFCLRLIDPRNFAAFWRKFGDVSGDVALIVTPLLLLLSMIFLAAWKVYCTPNKAHNKDSAQLKAENAVTDHTTRPLGRFLKRYATCFLRRWKWYRISFVLIWLYNFNFFTIAIEALAYLFYFSMSIDVIGLYTQIVKLLGDLSVAVEFLPTVLEVVIGYYLWFRFRFWLGLGKLRKYEKKNIDFLEGHPGALLVTGKQRSKKTSMITSMALSQMAIYRKKSYKAMKKRVKQFPYMPWRNVEQTIRTARKKHKIYTLATCRAFVWELRKLHENEKTMPNEVRRRRLQELRSEYGYRGNNFCFGYKESRYKTKYDDWLSIVDVFDAIEGYACSYLIYSTRSPLIYSNYSIRTDEIVKTHGNLENYDLDFFNRKAKDVSKISQRSHLLLGDLERLGKLKNPKGEFKDLLEFGIMNRMEAGKEYGNQYTQKGKKDDNNCNPKNDGHTIDRKMRGHAANVDNVDYQRKFEDDQRASSVNADDLQMSDIVQIKQMSEAKVVMPMSSFELAFCGWIEGFYDKLEDAFSYYRGDNTLLFHIVKRLCIPFANYKERVEKQFGIYTGTVKVLDGMDNEIKEKATKYYISVKKDYSERFATDGIGAFFQYKVARSKKGIDDVPQFKDKYMSFEEMRELQSHFYDDIAMQFDVKEWIRQAS